MRGERSTLVLDCEGHFSADPVAPVKQLLLQCQGVRMFKKTVAEAVVDFVEGADYRRGCFVLKQFVSCHATR